MSIIQIGLIGIGLAMDAFAVSICKGLKMKKIEYGQSVVIAIFFGGFQAIMPLIGWMLGKQFESYIVSIDHWIAFALLAFIGGKMLYEAIKNEEQDTCIVTFDLKELLILSIATSIDALAVGITFAFLKTNIWISIIIIGIITFILSFVAVIIGNKFGAKYKNKAEFAGGFILILIGAKILLEHLGLINF